MSNCWICEGWAEHRFVYEPGKSDDYADHDPFVPINLHLDIDHFKADLMLPSKGEPKVYEVYRMLPPGQHKYFYSIGGNIKVAKNQPQAHGYDKNLEKPKHLDLTKRVLPGDSTKKTEPPSRINSSQKKNSK